MPLRVSSRKWSVFRRKVCVLIEVITEALNKDEVTGFPGVPVVKNPLLMQFPSLNGEDSLEKEMAYSLQYSCLENPMDRGAWQVGYSLQGQKEPDTTEHACHT